MGDIDIPPGEVTQIAAASEGSAWEVQIKSGEARFDKNPNRIKNDGRLRMRGDRGTAELTRGERLYAYSPEGSTIYVTRGNFSFTLFSSTHVSRPRDSSSLEENVGSINVYVETETDFVYTTDDLEGRNQALTDIRLNGEAIITRTRDSEGNKAWETEYDPDDTPIRLDPAIPIPTGGSLLVRNESQVDPGDIDITYTYE